MAIVKTPRLKEQVYNSILSALRDGTIKPDYIYSEQWFTDYFDYEVSRTPVREALLQLRSEGLIEALPNRGFVIKRPTLKEAQHIFQMRAAIEGFCAAHLAKHHNTPEGIAALDRIEASMCSWRKSCSYEDCIQFHVETIEFSRNPFFISQFEQQRIKISIFWQSLMEAEHRSAEVDVEHSKILEYMRSGDIQNAYSASIYHSQTSLENIQRSGDFVKRRIYKPV